ncbi:MAG: ABC transporter permease [Candidatus Altiarchaeota archaeon]
MIQDLFNITLNGIKRKGIRSYLTILGIIIGITAVVSLISLGQGMQKAINEQFEILGSDIIIVLPGAESYSGLSSITSIEKLKKHDLELIKGINGVENAAGFFMRIAQVKFKGEVKYGSIVAFPTDDTQDILLKGTGIKIIEGQEKFKSTDKYKVAVGYLLGEEDGFFKKKVAIGDKIEINGREFDVVARVSQIGNPDDDSQMYIPIKTAEEIFNTKEEYMVIYAKVKDGYDVDKIAEKIKKEMRKDRNLKEGQENFSVQTFEKIRRSITSILDAVTWVIIGIAAISLIVGGVGIMNTMYTSVLERTQEIGVMKAIGAKNKDILLLFTIESGILGMIGGAIGCMIGITISKIVEIFAEQTLKGKLLEAYISLELIIGALAFSFFVGVISGILPAKQASELKPVDALRYE